MTPLMDALPASNAVLTTIAGSGASEDYDYAAAVDTIRWLGSEDAYVAEKQIEAVNGQRLDVVTQTRLIVPLNAGREVALGDIVTYEHNGATHSRGVRTVVVHDVSGEVSITLEDA